MFFIILVLVVAFAPPEAEAAISCNTVANALSPCMTFVISGGVPPVNCCNGARSLYNQATATADRQTVSSIFCFTYLLIISREMYYLINWVVLRFRFVRAWNRLLARPLRLLSTMQLSCRLSAGFLFLIRSALPLTAPSENSTYPVLLKLQIKRAKIKLVLFG